MEFTMLARTNLIPVVIGTCWRFKHLQPDAPRSMKLSA